MISLDDSMDGVFRSNVVSRANEAMCPATLALNRRFHSHLGGTVSIRLRQGLYRMLKAGLKALNERERLDD